jgi:hypothetical protein
MLIQRLEPKFSPGWDCRNGNCRSCDWLVENGRKRDNHGIHGDEYVFGIRTELTDGRTAALTLEIFTSRYPATVDRSTLTSWLDGRMPYGASLDLHLQVAPGGTGPYEGSIVHEKCDWLGPGKRCYCDGSSLFAEEIYKRSGIRSDAADVDLAKQPDALYAEMEHYLRIWTEGK